MINDSIIDQENEIASGSIPRSIVAIGTSTGGPKALQNVIPVFPADLPAAVLVVQHMPAGFTRSLAERLNSLSRLIVKEAEDGEIIKEGFAYIAPGDYHMHIIKTRKEIFKIKLTQDLPVGGLRPSVNVMMKSLSDTGFRPIVGVVMTGMGSDGSEGIQELKLKNGAYIITQDEETCAVYGMPKVAYQTGMVDKVLPLTKIAQEIMKIVEVQK